jgi:late competence protein required for DNA uptake (superfamily II DNA/RNA helicase)
MSCQRCGGVLAAELATAMGKLVCEMSVIENRYCHCDDRYYHCDNVEGPVEAKLPLKGRGALAGESPEVTTSEGRVL